MELQYQLSDYVLFPTFYKPGHHRQSQPVELDEELDVDFMRAIQLSLLHHSTPANQQSRQSSSSSSSAGSSRDQAQGLQGQQDLSIFSADSTSLQKAIELSLQDSAVAGMFMSIIIIVCNHKF